MLFTNVDACQNSSLRPQLLRWLDAPCPPHSCRLTGWAENGNALRPGYESYIEDSAAPITKMARPGVESGFKVAAPAGIPDAGSVRV